MVDAIVLALALAMDATAVAVACGAAGIPAALGRRMAAMFSLFHVAMATIGWIAGSAAEAWIATWDHWLAFGLLAAIGVHMVFSAVRHGVITYPAGWRTLVALALATSVDAVVAGITLPLVDAPELVTIALIGGVVYVLALVGVRAGAILGERFGRVLQIMGGITLLGLGAKVAIDHLR